MPTARDEEQPYEGGGAGGKFRKRPFRRSLRTTPYDRPPPPPPLPPPRNPNGWGGGWLSKLVDPAQRLIASGAHRLFSTVLRRRLPPPPQPLPPLSPPEINLEARKKQQEAVTTDFHGAEIDAVEQIGGPSNASGELTELEQILKQKTFTRSEIGHLTALLHSRTIGLGIEEQDKISEVVPLKPTASTDKQEGFRRAPAEGNRLESEGFPKTPAPGNRAENQLVSTPVVNSIVLEGDAASPTELVELAKSYMHKRPISPSMLGFRSQAMVENSTATYTRNLNSPSRLPFSPLVPRITSGHAEAQDNGFITPRSRGRSAIYNMARTPYSRVHPTATSKGAENAVDVYGGISSSSQYAQGGLKRRSSVLENDIGSFGAIRRTRQKPNLLSSRGLSLPISGSPLSSSGTVLGYEASQNPLSKSKPLSFGEPVRNPTKSSAENGDNNVLNTTVPSKSSEMASKILQQLDKLVSPKDKSSEPKVLALMDKSPSKLSPSMLRGQALKSLEDVDSSKFLGDVQHNELFDGSPSQEIPNAKASTSQEQGKVLENGPLKLGSADYKLSFKVNGSAVPRMNGEVSTVPKKDAFTGIGTSVPAASNSVAYIPQKKRAFQMSALEDFVDLDEDSLPNGTGSDLLPERKGNVNFSVAESKNTAVGCVKPEKASALTEIRPVSLEINPKTEIGISTGSMTAEKSSNLSFQSTYSPSLTVMPSVISTESSLTSDRGTLVKDSNVSPPAFNLGAKIASANDTSAASPLFSFGLKNADKVPQSQGIVSPSIEYGTVNSVAYTDPKPETPSNLSTVAATKADSLPKLPEPDKADDQSNSSSGVSLRSPASVLPSAASTSSTSIFSFGATPTNVSLNNGLSASVSSTPVVFNNLTSQNSSDGNISSASMTTATTLLFASSTGSLSTSTPVPSVPAASVFKFASSTPSTALAPVSETSSPGVAPVFSFVSTTTSTAAAPVLEISPAPAAPVFKFGSTTASTAGAPASETSSAPAAPVFKFGSSTPSTSFAPVSETSNVVSEAIKTQQDASFANLSTPPATAATTASTLFGFTASTTSTSTNQSQSSPFGASTVTAPNALALSAGTGVATFTQNVPVQFGSSASSPTFGLAGSTTSDSGSLPFASTLDAKPFSPGTTPGFGSSSSSENNLVNLSSSSTSSVFGSTWLTPKSPVFSFNSSPSTGFSFGASSAPSATNSSPSTGFSFGASSASSAAASSSLSAGFSFGASAAPNAAASSSPSTGFSFGASSASTAVTNTSPSPFGVIAPSAATSGAPMPFGSSNGAASSSSLFTFNSSSTTASTQPVFGNSSPTFAFGATPGSNDQMNMEDSMAEDTVQASAPAVPVFGQQPISQSPPAFTFGSAAAAVGNPFQFGSQPNLANPQNPSPFQASGSLGSNFSMGSGGSGVDKSNRKFVKVKHKQRKK